MTAQELRQGLRPTNTASERARRIVGPESGPAKDRGTGVAGACAPLYRGSIPDGEKKSGPAEEAPEPEGNLADSLLHQEVPTDDGRGRWAYPLWAKLIVTMAILVHGTILIVYALPGKGLSKGTHKWFNEHLDMNTYLRATGTRQSWAMFAPNPNRTNIFIRVLVEDKDGEIWDLKHDIYGKRTYPYLWYSRMGKVNRRLARTAGYRRHYAAWVCRTWEKEHGELPKEVSFVKLYTRIPKPEKLWKMTRGKPWQGYDPMKVKVRQKDEGSFRCATTPHAQLPNYMRERFGMEPMEEGHFRPVRIRTWVDLNEAEERKAERERKREEQSEAREARREALRQRMRLKKAADEEEQQREIEQQMGPEPGELEDDDDERIVDDDDAEGEGD